jgi:predicted aspartyl protease
MEVDGSGHVVIPVLVDGHKIDAQVDTGSVSSIMSLSAAHHFLDFDEHDPAVKTSTEGNVTVYSYPFKTMAFEGITVMNPSIAIWPDKDMKAFNREIILGMSVLRQLHVYIAYKEGKMYLTPASAH